MKRSSERLEPVYNLAELGVGTYTALTDQEQLCVARIQCQLCG